MGTDNEQLAFAFGEESGGEGVIPHHDRQSRCDQLSTWSDLH
jgi:hypothetical protein